MSPFFILYCFLYTHFIEQNKKGEKNRQKAHLNPHTPSFFLLFLFMDAFVNLSLWICQVFCPSPCPHVAFCQVSGDIE